MSDEELREAVRALPEALYSCLHCAEDRSWPAGDLNWSEKERGWVCGICWCDRWDENDEELGDEERGPSLKAEIKMRELAAARRLLSRERLSEGWLDARTFYYARESHRTTVETIVALAIRDTEDRILGPAEQENADE